MGERTITPPLSNYKIYKSYYIYKTMNRTSQVAVSIQIDRRVRSLDISCS